jgi:hypothetical protein
MFKRLRDKFSAEARKHPKINSFLKGTVWTLRALILLRLVYVLYSVGWMLMNNSTEQFTEQDWWNVGLELATLLITFLITGVAI